MGKVLNVSAVAWKRFVLATAFVLAICCTAAVFASPAWAAVGPLPEGARAVDAMTPDESLGASRGSEIPDTAAVGVPGEGSSMGLLADDSVFVGVVGNVRQSEGRKLLAMVNAARAKVGAPALNWDVDLEATAIQRAAELMLRFTSDHARPDGRSCFTAYPDCGAAGENIALGYGSAVAVNTGWTNSPGHYSNMVNRGFTSMGAACVQGYDGTLYWVEAFSDRAGTGMIGNTINATYSVIMRTAPSLLNVKFTDCNVAPRSQTHMVFVSGKNLLDGDVFSYSSSNEKVAGVSTEDDSFGALQGRTFGSATLTAYYYQTTRRVGSFTVTVRFSDAPASAWYMADGWVPYVLEHDLMGGYSGTVKFGPNDNLTRGQVATIIYRAATGDKNPDNNVSAGFSDVPAGQYYTAAVKWAAQAGIVTGFGNTGRFAPDDHVTREQLATMLGRYTAWEMSDGATVDALPASDVAFKALPDSGASSSFAVPYLTWCADKGIMGGNGRLTPGGKASRAEMAKMITVIHRDVLRKG